MADAADRQLAVADVYASALFSLAEAQNQVDQVRRELDELVRLRSLSSDFAAFMESSALDDDVREAEMDRMFRGKLSDLTLQTLLVMTRHGRNALLGPLHRAFQQRQIAAAGQVEASVVSAVDLGSAERSEIERCVAEISGLKPLMSFQVDPELLGGLVVQIGDVRYDNSVRRQLLVARGQLLERSSHGLPVSVSD